MKKLLLLILSIFILYSCDSGIFSGKLKEGIIKYKLEYFDNPENMAIISVLPTEMEVKFKPNHYLQSVDGWMGIFRMAGYNNMDKNQKTALLKMMNKKYIYQVTGETGGFGFDPMAGKKLEFTNETKEIAGYKCKKVKVTWKDKKFDIYYTTKIKIEDPNWNNPFPEIDGVLMEYQISMFGINTKITATQVTKQNIPDEDFIVPAGYKNVSKKEMEDVINKLMVN
jgi:GLPGLI family protein